MAKAQVPVLKTMFTLPGWAHPSLDMGALWPGGPGAPLGHFLNLRWLSDDQGLVPDVAGQSSLLNHGFAFPGFSCQWPAMD